MPAFLMMNMSPTLVWVKRVGNILESTQVTNTAVGIGLSRTLWNCSSMFLCQSVLYFMIPCRTLLMPRDPFRGILSEMRRSSIEKL